MSVVLPAPFGPEESEYLALLDLQADVIQRLYAPHPEAGTVDLAQPDDADNRFDDVRHGRAIIEGVSQLSSRPVRGPPKKRAGPKPRPLSTEGV